MTMPLDLVLVRHGQSEGNVAKKRSKSGDDSDFTEEFCGRHSSSFRLTDRGREQARLAGEWVRAKVGERFGRYYVSESIRTKETAALLGLPDARWYQDFYLRERDYGHMDIVTESERKSRFSEHVARRPIDGMFWMPPGGESIAQVCLRVDRVLQTLHRECTLKRVIIVCHGELMWAFRIRLERLSQESFLRMSRSTDPRDKIHNGQVLHYSRHDPDTLELHQHVVSMRSVCPNNLALSRNEWQPVIRPTFTNEELLVEVEQVKQQVK
jgi:NAD+ kinase